MRARSSKDLSLILKVNNSQFSSIFSQICAAFAPGSLPPLGAKKRKNRKKKEPEHTLRALKLRIEAHLAPSRNKSVIPILITITTIGDCIFSQTPTASDLFPWVSVCAQAYANTRVSWYNGLCVYAFSHESVYEFAPP